MSETDASPTAVGTPLAAPAAPLASDSVVVERFLRAFRAVAALLTVASAVVWLRPINVPGQNFQPFGCGSAAAPASDDLARLVCDGSVGRFRGIALGLIVAALLVLVVGEMLAKPLGRRRPLVMWALLPAIGGFTDAVTKLLLPIVVHGADGAKIRCGTPLSPVTDALVRGQCGSVPEGLRATAFGVLVGSALLVGLAFYVGGAVHAGVAHAGLAPAAATPDEGSVDSLTDDARTDDDGTDDGYLAQDTGGQR